MYRYRYRASSFLYTFVVIFALLDIFWVYRVIDWFLKTFKNDFGLYEVMQALVHSVQLVTVVSVVLAVFKVVFGRDIRVIISVSSIILTEIHVIYFTIQHIINNKPFNLIQLLTIILVALYFNIPAITNILTVCYITENKEMFYEKLQQQAITSNLPFTGRLIKEMSLPMSALYWP